MDRPPNSILRIIHVSFGLHVGGQEKLLLEFARQAGQKRLALTMVSLAKRGTLAGELEASGANVIAMAEPFGFKPRLIWRLARLFRGIKPHVVHTHDRRSLIHAAPAARLAAVPQIIHTRHGRDVGRTPRQILAVRLFSRFVNRFVCVSGDLAALSLADGIAPQKLQTILNGIDLDRFAFSGPAEDGPTVAVSRLCPEKDIANLVRAAAIVRQSESDFRLELAGDGPCRDELEQLVGELGLNQCITFLGKIRDVPSLLARGAIFVLPSRSEGVPLTVLEAMACGLPVVATRIGGTPEIVVEKETGLLVPSCDPAALADAILRLRRDPEAARQMGRAGRCHVERNFSIRRMVDDYLALYLEAGHSEPPASSRVYLGPLTRENPSSAPIVE